MILALALVLSPVISEGRPILLKYTDGTIIKIYDCHQYTISPVICRGQLVNNIRDTEIYLNEDSFSIITDDGATLKTTYIGLDRLSSLNTTINIKYGQQYLFTIDFNQAYSYIVSQFCAIGANVSGNYKNFGISQVVEVDDRASEFIPRSR